MLDDIHLKLSCIAVPWGLDSGTRVDLRGRAMATITEEHDSQESKPQQSQKRPANPSKTKPSAGPTLLFLSLSSLSCYSPSLLSPRKIPRVVFTVEDDPIASENVIIASLVHTLIAHEYFECLRRNFIGDVKPTE